MRANLILTGTAAFVLLGAGTAAASPEATCEGAKLRAAGHYFRCVAEAEGKAILHGEEVFDDATAWCDERFDRAFERAEAGGACRTPGGPSTLREPLEAQLLATLDNLATSADCTITDDTAVCELDKDTSAVDLAALLEQLSDQGVTGDTAFWIQAWGGDGHQGNTSRAGGGGKGGYAQTTTTLNAYEAAFGWCECRRRWRHGDAGHGERSDPRRRGP